MQAAAARPIVQHAASQSYAEHNICEESHTCVSQALLSQESDLKVSLLLLE